MRRLCPFLLLSCAKGEAPMKTMPEASGVEVPWVAQPEVTDAEVAHDVALHKEVRLLDGGDPRHGTYVLHIGDSFTHASFQQNLGPRLRALGVRYHVSAKTPSYTTSWAADPELDKLLWNRPSLVIITLGANEVDNTVPGEHAPAVRALARKASAHSACVWVSPPMWKKTQFLKVIEENASPCLYFDSDHFAPDVPRQRDGIHPNAEGGKKWADAFWQWLEEVREPSRGPWALSPDTARRLSSKDPR